MLFSTPATLTTSEVVDWHELCCAGLVQQQLSIGQRIVDSKPLPPYLASVLFGATLEEVDIHFSSSRQELDISACLTLIASAEARIRLDAAKRKESGNNPLSIRLTSLFSKAPSDWSVPLYEDGILDIWKQVVWANNSLDSAEKMAINSRIGGFKKLLIFRHWLAHGRYWKLTRAIETLTPAVTAKVIDSLYSALNDAAKSNGTTAFL